MKFEYCTATDKGLVRERNEDNMIVLPEAGIFMVADGMGGHVGGEIASSITVETIRDYYSEQEGEETPKSVLDMLKEKFGLRTSGEARLYDALERANMAVYDEGMLLDPVRGVGTTVVVGYLHGSTLFVLYSGDSRLYRLRNGRLKQITKDHSLLNRYLDEKRITPKEAPYFPYKNVILQALGLSPDCKAEVRRTKVQAGDVYLFCTDGLTDMVGDQEIQDIMNFYEDIHEICPALINSALSEGGLDNITVLVLKIGD